MMSKERNLMLEQINNQEQSLSQKTVDKLVEHIKTSGLKSGDRIPNETELCNALSVSRSTVREAIKILVSRNILTIQRGVGTFISSNPGLTDDPLGLDFIEDKAQLLLNLLQFRSIIEPALVRLAAKNATDGEIEALCRYEDNIEKAYMAGTDTTEDDIQFHITIARCSHNHVVELVFPILMKAIPAVNRYTKKSLMEGTISDHRAIIQAIRDKNGELAEALMQQHLKRNTEYISKKL